MENVEAEILNSEEINSIILIWVVVGKTPTVSDNVLKIMLYPGIVVACTLSRDLTACTQVEVPPFKNLKSGGKNSGHKGVRDTVENFKGNLTLALDVKIIVPNDIEVVPEVVPIFEKNGRNFIQSILYIVSTKS